MRTKRNPDYPGVTPGMLRSLSAGVLRFGGVGGVKGAGRTRREKLPDEMYLVEDRRARGTTAPAFAHQAHSNFGSTAMTTQSVAAQSDGNVSRKGPDKADGGDDPDEKLVETLTQQCNQLAWRLMAVERELAESKRRGGYNAYREEHGDVLGLGEEEGGDWGEWGDMGATGSATTAPSPSGQDMLGSTTMLGSTMPVSFGERNGDGNGDGDGKGDDDGENANFAKRSTMTAPARQTQMRVPSPSRGTVGGSPSRASTAQRSSSRRSTRGRSRTRTRTQTGSISPEGGQNEPLHPRVLPIQKAAGQLTTLVTDLSKSMFGDEEAVTEAKQISDALLQREKEKKRYDAYLLARGEWKRLNSEGLLMVLRMELNRQQIMREKVQVFKKMLEKRKSQVFLREWHKVMQLNLKARKSTITASLEMESRHFNRFLRLIMKEWFDVATGPYSRKGAMDRFRARMDAARVTLAEKLKLKGEELGKITKEMLVEEMRKTVVEKMAASRAKFRVKISFHACRNAVIMTREAEEKAKRHYSVTMFRKIFYPWTEWSHLNSVGLDRARWPQARKMVVRYNQTAVDSFAKRRVEKLVFSAWKPVSMRYTEAKRMRRRNISEFIRKHIYAWQEVGKKQAEMKKLAVHEWRNYSIRIMMVPFRMWFLWSDSRKRKRADQKRLINSYHRAKNRKFLWNILKGWRHQAVYGRIAGLYSRNDLMKSLTEQKQQCITMERQMNSYVGTVNEMNSLLEDNTKRVAEMEEEIKKKDEKSKIMRMAMHHAEQEIIQMQSLVDCVAQIHPVVHKHIEKLQPDFNFSNRGLMSLVKMRQDEEIKTGRGTELEADDLEKEDDDGALIVEEKEAGEAAKEEDGDQTDSADQNAQAEEGLGKTEAKSAPKITTDESAISVKSFDKDDTDNLKRMEFVLKRTNFRDVKSIGGANLDGDGEINKEALLNEVTTLYGLFEFLRNGSQDMLSERVREEFRKGTDVVAEKGEEVVKEGEGGSTQDAQITESDDGIRKPVVAVEEVDSTSTAIAEEKKDDALPPKKKSWKKLTNQQPSGNKLQWKDFMLKLNYKLPAGRKTETPQDRLMARMQKSIERTDSMMGLGEVGNGGTENIDEKKDCLFTGKEFEDHFEPEEPAPWDHK